MKNQPISGGVGRSRLSNETNLISMVALIDSPKNQWPLLKILRKLNLKLCSSLLHVCAVNILKPVLYEVNVLKCIFW